MAADASAIYERFLHTPLKIKPASKASAEAPPSDDTVRAAVTARNRREGEPEVERPEVGLDATTASQLPPQVSPTRKELIQLHISKTASDSSKGSTAGVNGDDEIVVVEGSFEKERDGTSSGKTAGERSVAAACQRKTHRTSSVVKPKTRKMLSTAETNGDVTEPIESVAQDRKTKRVSRLVIMENPSTGGATLDTPTKAAQPAKRSKKAAAGNPEGGTEKENRALLSEFINCIGSDEKELATPQKIAIPGGKKSTRSRRPATPPARRSRRIQSSQPDAPIDYITSACDELLATDTISGALFSVVLNSLRDIQEDLSQACDFDLSSLNPFQSVKNVCMGIAKCEELAQSQNREISKQALQHRRRGSKSTLTKKSVRFQSFDLSCLSLQYVRNVHTEGLVDKILRHYDGMMSHVLSMLRKPNQNTSGDTVEARILRDLVEMLNDKSMLYKNPDTLGEEAERIYLAAFGSKDPHAQHEIQTCRSYFANEFRKLVVDPNSPVPSPTKFLEKMFSSLVSSSMRYKLRALFLEHALEESEDGRAQPNMACYTHQDFGSSVHWALQESLLYRPLAVPILKLLERKSAGGASDVMKYLKKVEVDDFEHIEQFILARRFLRYHIKKSYEAPSADGFTARTWSSIERICRIAKRYVVLCMVMRDSNTDCTRSLGITLKTRRICFRCPL